MRSSLGLPSSLRFPGSGSGVMEARMVPFPPSLTLVSSIPGVDRSLLRRVSCWAAVERRAGKKSLLNCCEEFSSKKLTEKVLSFTWSINWIEWVIWNRNLRAEKNFLIVMLLSRLNTLWKCYWKSVFWKSSSFWLKENMKSWEKVLNFLSWCWWATLARVAMVLKEVSF